MNYVYYINNDGIEIYWLKESIDKKEWIKQWDCIIVLSGDDFRKKFAKPLHWCVCVKIDENQKMVSASTTDYKSLLNT